MIRSQKLLARYRVLKQAVPDCLLLMQVGAFMQVMDNDARTVSQVTGLQLQMAGVAVPCGNHEILYFVQDDKSLVAVLIA